MQIFQVPDKYFRFQNQPGFFITHYGEIYPGQIIHCPNYNKGVFIISIHNLSEIINFTEDEKTPENYSKLGWEIQDFNIIERAVFELFPPNHPQTDRMPLDIRTAQYKRMFVFGAAASKFCLYDAKLQENLTREAFCPPLGTEIFDSRFDELCKKYPGVMQSIDAWDLSGRDIEQFLEEQWRFFRDTYDPVLPNRHINIQFFLQDLFLWISDNVWQNYKRSNLYNTLVEKIRLQSLKDGFKTSFVSFNYDTILDRFISNYFVHSLKDIDSYINSNAPFALLKPHGSANWGFKLKPQDFQAIPKIELQRWLFQNKNTLSDIYFRLIDEFPHSINPHGYGLEYSINPKSKTSKYTIDKDRIEVMPPSDWRNKYFPALLMPYRDKDEFVMPYRHQLGLRLLCEEAEELYLIGWKGNEAHFNQQLARATKLKRIIIVNPEPEVVKQNLSGFINLESIAITEINDFKTFVLNQLDNHLNGQF